MSKKTVGSMAEAIGKQLLNKKRRGAKIILLGLLPDERNDVNNILSMRTGIELDGNTIKQAPIYLNETSYLIGHCINDLAKESGIEFNQLINNIRTAFICSREENNE